MSTARAFLSAKRQSGSVTIAALGVLAVTLALVGVALMEAGSRFRISHHSERWTQAGQAAEAGAEIALMSSQTNSWIADGWSEEPEEPGDPAVSRTLNLASADSPTGEVTVSIAVDKVNLGGRDWLRVRSTGQVNVAGGSVAGLDARDSLLRKLSLRHDRRTGAAVSTPRATRTIEILAEPRLLRPFKQSFVAKQLFDIHAGTTVDSYDSSDDTKSNFAPHTTHGVYDPAKRQTNGDVATLDTSAAWNLNDAHIWGDVLSPTGNTAGSANVHGAVVANLDFTIPDEVSPAWTTVTQNHGIVANVSKTLAGGTQSDPARHKFTSIQLTDAGAAIQIENPPGTNESWVEVWVTGDTFIGANSLTGINVAPGVHCTIHFGGRVEVVGGNGGYGINNGSQLPSNLVLRAYGGGAGAIQDFILAYSDFWGVVAAPWYKVKFDSAGKHVHGSFLAWQMDCADGTSLHYDEALADFALGSGAGFAVRSWVEAVR